MEFLKIRSFRGIGKFKVKKDSNQDRDLMNLDLEKPNDEELDTMLKADASDPVVKAVEDEDDDDFVTNEVKRRLKELRKNSFMVLIPEEGYPEEEEGGGSSSSGWRGSEEGGDAPWCTFKAIYAKYTERMTFFDKLMVKSLKEAGMNEKGVEDSDEPVLATDLIRIIEESILTFLLFLRMDKKKSGFLFQVQSSRSPLQQLQASFEKKEIKVKEILRRKKGWKKKTWPETEEEVELLFALVDIKVISRVLRMTGLTKEQLLWCEEKMSKLDDSDKKPGRVLSTNLFPC